MAMSIEKSMATAVAVLFSMEEATRFDSSPFWMLVVQGNASLVRSTH